MKKLSKHKKGRPPPAEGRCRATTAISRRKNGIVGLQRHSEKENLTPNTNNKRTIMRNNTLKALSLNSRGYADRRTYGNRTTAVGMHAEGVPQQRGWATPSGSMSSVCPEPSVGSANPRLLIMGSVLLIIFLIMIHYCLNSHCLP